MVNKDKYYIKINKTRLTPNCGDYT